MEAAQAQIETVEIPPMTDMQRLCALRREILTIESGIAAAEAACGINTLRKRLAEKDSEFSVLLAAVSRRVVFSEDKFLKAIKKRGESYREGDGKIIRTSTTRRSIDRARFVAAHKDLALAICTIPIKAAEEAIGKRALDAFCEKNTTYSYQFTDMSEHSETGEI